MAKSHIVEMGRKGNRIRVACPEWMIVESPTDCFRRLCGVLAIVAAAPLELHLVAEISDGEDGGPGLINFCSRDPASILIPDHIFIRSRGYEVDRRLARAWLSTMVLR
jgi:hypothetical protein